MIIQTVGYLGIFLIIFAESGMFFAFFLPGDSLLFSAGVLAAAGNFSLFWVMITVIIGSVFGGLFGYYFGKRVSETIFTKKDTLFFKKKHLDKTAQFYAQHGPKAVLFARFIPIVRTFAPILAGASLMHYRKFIIWNLIGGITWALLLPWLGYAFGSKIPNIDSYLLPIIIGIMVVSCIPIFYKLIKDYYIKKTS